MKDCFGIQNLVSYLPRQHFKASSMPLHCKRLFQKFREMLRYLIDTPSQGSDVGPSLSVCQLSFCGVLDTVGGFLPD